MKRTGIGELEELVMLTICVLDNEAYALSIKNEIEIRTHRTLNISAIHTTLYRLQDKGLLSSKLGDSNSVRGGKKKRLFSVTAYGLKSLSQVKDNRLQLWRDIPSLVLKTLTQ